MRKFLILIFMSWVIIGTLSNKLYNSDDPKVIYELTKKMIELTREAQTGCQGATIFFRPEEEDQNKIDVIVKCIKWEI